MNVEDNAIDNLVNYTARRRALIPRLIKMAAERIDRLDAEILLAHVLEVSRAELCIYGEGVTFGQLEKFDGFVDERAAGRPLQHIIGKTGFMGLEFIVTPDVLIPRSETELLVEETIRYCDALKGRADTKSAPAYRKDVHILDLCTGAGNIAISLTKFITDCKIKGSDYSEQALYIAEKNARRNNADNRIEFVLSDLFENLKGEKFDIIVSNPPYVPSSDIDKLGPEIAFEPRSALDGGADGLDFYRKIISGSGVFFKKGGALILELGFGQKDAVKTMLQRNNFCNIAVITDYNNIPRIINARWTG